MKGRSLQLYRGALQATTVLSPVEHDPDISLDDYYLKRRWNEVFAVYCRGKYIIGTKTKDEPKAKEFLRDFRIQKDAEAQGLYNLRWANAIAVCDFYLAGKAARWKQNRKDGVRRALARLRPHLQGKRVWQIDDIEIGRIMEALRSRKPKPYTDATIFFSIAEFRFALRYWCRKQGIDCVLPFDRLSRPQGRIRFLKDFEQAELLRYADSEDSYDPKTRTWSPPLVPLSETEYHRRKMFGRLLRLGLGTGSRPNRIMTVGWKPSTEHGWIDLESGILFRLPMGAHKSALKRSPPVRLSPELLAQVRQWREEDGPDIEYVIHRRDGRPGDGWAGPMFLRVMRMFGLHDVGRHTLRHSLVTGMVARRVPIGVIASVTGMRVETVRNNYDHVEDTVVQPIAHPEIDRLLREGIPTVH